MRDNMYGLHIIKTIICKTKKKNNFLQNAEYLITS